jgi:hypothetical protein
MRKRKVNHGSVSIATDAVYLIKESMDEKNTMPSRAAAEMLKQIHAMRPKVEHEIIDEANQFCWMMNDRNMVHAPSATKRALERLQQKLEYYFHVESVVEKRPNSQTEYIIIVSKEDASKLKAMGLIISNKMEEITQPAPLSEKNNTARRRSR